MSRYSLHKSNAIQSGKYQILEHGFTCGIYFTKKDALLDLKKLLENELKEKSCPPQ